MTFSGPYISAMYIPALWFRNAAFFAEYHTLEEKLYQCFLQ